jgi:hypothetical protein
MKIRLTVVEKIESKLKFVKLLKDVSGLGLKEAKDIADYLCENIGKSKELDINSEFKDSSGNMIDSIYYLNNELPYCGGRILLNGGKEWQREFKMLSLGIGESEDYSYFIKEYLSTNREFLDNVLSKLKKEDLQKLINEIVL